MRKVKQGRESSTASQAQRNHLNEIKNKISSVARLSGTKYAFLSIKIC